MKISIVTVVLNDAKGLARTIESVTAQKISNVEHIVIDGGSTDSTMQVAARFEKHLADVVSEQDNGIYDAMNKGVSRSTGKYICFLNAGDVFSSGTVLKVFNKYVEQNSNIDAVFYGDHRVLHAGRINNIRRSLPVERINYGMICCHQSMFFPKQALQPEGYSLNYGTAGDFELVARLYNRRVPFVRMRNFVVADYQAGGVSDVQRIPSLRNTMKALRELGMLSIGSYLYFKMAVARAFLVSLVK